MNCKNESCSNQVTGNGPYCTPCYERWKNNSQPAKGQDAEVAKALRELNTTVSMMNTNIYNLIKVLAGNPEVIKKFKEDKRE